MNTLPNYQMLMKPVLEFYGDKKEHALRDAGEYVADYLRLTTEQRAERTSSGTPVYVNRVSWAHTYLKRAGLLESVRKGVSRIIPRGEKVLATGLEEITNADLMQFEEFRAFKQGDKGSKDRGETKTIDLPPISQTSDLTPEELIDSAMSQHTNALEEELLEVLRKLDPVYFEQVILDLLEAMGYGVGSTTKVTGDGGVDGIVNEDALGLSQIYIQAKRYKDGNVVNGKEIRDFYGALAINQVAKGVFITTSSFNQIATATSPPHMKVIFIDGKQLAGLLIKHNIGMTPIKQFVTKSIDSDYYQMT